MRMDWNSILAEPESGDDALVFTNYSDLLFPDAPDFLRYLADYAEKHQVKVRYAPG